MFGSQSEKNTVFSHPVSFSESSSTFAEDNQQENMAASSFIEYSGHFLDFLPEGASDISSININIEPSIINSVGILKKMTSRSLHLVNQKHIK